MDKANAKAHGGCKANHVSCDNGARQHEDRGATEAADAGIVEEEKSRWALCVEASGRQKAARGA
jgi:hypothetical protein